MTSHHERISRRNVLRGAGVAMALPWLESLPTYAGDAAPRRRRKPSRVGSPRSSWATE